ncbi:ARP2/3 actin-organizing complex subunit Sop2 [Savitreella phatthalungensis]
MVATQVHLLNLGGPITAHAFNADRSLLAVSKNSSVIEIYKREGGKDGGFVLETSLKDHDKLVTSIDWAPSSDKIVTCSQDRNANVWVRDPSAASGWKPTLVLLRINRGATQVKWSPHEDKFAVASSARLIAICYFEQENNWWISKHLKKPIRSTILSLDWHPNNVLLAAGGTDMRVRVFSAFIKDVDERPAPTVWGTRLPFNTVCMEAATEGWVHDVRFSPSGDEVAYVTHASTIESARPSGNEDGSAVVASAAFAGLPMTTLAYITEDSIAVAGHNCAPVLFKRDGEGSWVEDHAIDGRAPDGGASGGIGGAASGSDSAFKSLRNSFRDMDLKGGSADTSLPTVHQNTITQLTAYYGERGAIKQISTSGVDGRVVVWQL